MGERGKEMGEEIEKKGRRKRREEDFERKEGEEKFRLREYF